MNKIKLIYKGVSEIVGKNAPALIILTDVAETRQVTVMCDHHMEREFGYRLAKDKDNEKRIPEVLTQIIPELRNSQYEILIHSIVDGEYRAALVNKQDISMVPMRVADAILLATVGKWNIFMEEKLLMRQSVPYKEGERGMAMPINTLSKDMLQKALDAAIADEDYELASQIRDEINRRQ